MLINSPASASAYPLSPLLFQVLPDGSAVHKLFSRELLPEATLAAVFAEIREVYIHEWKAYPVLPGAPQPTPL